MQRTGNLSFPKLEIFSFVQIELLCYRLGSETLEAMVTYCCVGTFKKKKEMQGLHGTSFTVTKTFNGILRIDEKHNCDIVPPLLSSSAKCVVSIFVFCCFVVL